MNTPLPPPRILSHTDCTNLQYRCPSIMRVQQVVTRRRPHAQLHAQCTAYRHLFRGVFAGQGIGVILSPELCATEMDIRQDRQPQMEWMFGKESW